MAKEFSLDLESSSKPEDEKFIGDRLAEYNAREAGPDNHQPLNVFLRGEQGQLIGGLLGGTYWGWLVIEILWLSKEVRGQGYGRKMVQMAEQEAIKRGCRHAHLDTMSFQAPDFYTRLGYSEFGKLEGLPTRHSRHYLQKQLAEPEIIIEPATLEDAETILEIQKQAYMEEAIFYDDFDIPPLTQTLEETIDEFKTQLILKATLNGEIIGSARGYLEAGTCYVGKMMVNPDLQNRGIGTQLLHAIEQQFPEAQRYELFTGYKSKRNLHLYQKHGYKIFKAVPINDNVSLSFLEKPGPGAA